MSLNFDLSNYSLSFFNSEAREKQTFVPMKGKQVNMYTCGPTVYDFAHIGNFRTYVFEDLLRRTFKFFGFTVNQVMNLTDVDDKTIKGATVAQVSLEAYTKPFKEAFFQDLKTLNIEPAEHYPQATDYIASMIDIIKDLMKKGVAYQGADQSIYYAIAKFPRYGCLSHLKLDELQVGASNRIAQDEYDKDHLADFVLWKAYDSKRDGEIFWESPFGPGRPGWHLECSAMAMKILGPTIDLHLGGVDNLFPHHENEIAQSEAYSEKPFSRFWMHSEHLLVDHKKMSKSLGNFYRLKDLLAKGYTGREVRYLLLQTHYKTQLNFTFKGLEGAKSTLNRLRDFKIRLKEVVQKESSKEIFPLLQQSFDHFAQALADDLNISAALATLFDLIREVNVLCDLGKVNKEEAAQVLKLLDRFDQVLGVLSFEEEESISQELEELLEKRIQARKEKNWILADQIRDEILAKGYVIEDTAQSIRLKKVNL